MQDPTQLTPARGGQVLSRHYLRARARRIGFRALLLLTALQVYADDNAVDQAKQSQNPIADLISVPFQNNANLNVGPQRETLNVLNVQPVTPVSLSPDWTVITRTIIPIISEPPPSLEGNRTYGIGDVLFSARLSPGTSGSWILGAGPAIQAPTHSKAVLGNDNWGAGPTFVVLHLEATSPWVYGVLANNVWSLHSSSSARSYNNGLMQPFVNYNLGHGTYLVSAPIVTVNWTAASNQQWTVPMGGGIGHIAHWGKLPVNMQISASCVRRKLPTGRFAPSCSFFSPSSYPKDGRYVTVASFRVKAEGEVS